MEENHQLDDESWRFNMIMGFVQGLFDGKKHQPVVPSVPTYLAIG